MAEERRISPAVIIPIGLALGFGMAAVAAMLVSARPRLELSAYWGEEWHAWTDPVDTSTFVTSCEDIPYRLKVRNTGEATASFKASYARQVDPPFKPRPVWSDIIILSPGEEGYLNWTIQICQSDAGTVAPVLWELYQDDILVDSVLTDIGII